MTPSRSVRSWRERSPAPEGGFHPSLRFARQPTRRRSGAPAEGMAASPKAERFYSAVPVSRGLCCAAPSGQTWLHAWGQASS